MLATLEDEMLFSGLSDAVAVATKQFGTQLCIYFFKLFLMVTRFLKHGKDFIGISVLLITEKFFDTLPNSYW
jgi:hypothetical protein